MVYANTDYSHCKGPVFFKKNIIYAIFSCIYLIICFYIPALLFMILALILEFGLVIVFKIVAVFVNYESRENPK